LAASRSKEAKEGKGGKKILHGKNTKVLLMCSFNNVFAMCIKIDQL